MNENEDYEFTDQEYQSTLDDLDLAIGKAEKENNAKGIERLRDIRGSLIRMEDYIRIDEEICIKKCGGRCCINIDVTINPYDVWCIVHSSNSPIKKTTDLFSKEPEKEPFMELYLGDTSRLPMACINFVKFSDDFKFCPFLAPALNIKSKRDLYFFETKQFDKIRATVQNGAIKMLCVLQETKPTVCRSSPIGRINVMFGKNPKNLLCYKLPAPNCQINQTSKKEKVRDYLARTKLLEYYKYSTLARDILFDTLKLPEMSRLFLAHVLYNFDSLIEFDLTPEPKRTFKKLTKRPDTFEELLSYAKEVKKAMELSYGISTSKK